MVSALAQLVPLAIAAALSSVPITATIVILLSPRRSLCGPAFLAGWVLGMAAVVLASAIGAGALPIPEFHPTGWGFGGVQVLVGVALVVYGLIAAIRAIRSPRLSSTNRWLAAVSSFGPLAVFGLAVALNFRPKGLLLGIAAGLVVAGASISWTESLVGVLVFLVIAVSTVVLPIVVTLAAPGWTEPRLVTLRDWLDRHGIVVTALAMGVIGVVLAISGLSKLV